MTDLNKLNEEFYKPYLTINKYFRITGINIFDEKTSLLTKLKYTHYLVFSLYIFNSISHWHYVLTAVSGGADLLELAVDLSYCSNTIEGCLIYFHVCIIKNRIKDYVMMLENQWRNDDTLTENAVLMKRDQVRQIDKYTYVYCAILGFFIHSYLAAPLIVILVKKILKMEVEYTTPLNFTLPFDYKSNLVIFMFVYLLEYVIGWGIAYLINCSIFFLVVTMNQLRTLFLMLQEDFKAAILSEDVDNELKKTIQRHSTLSKLLSELGTAFGSVFAIHMIFCSVHVCFYGIAAKIYCRLEDLKNLMASVILIVNIYHCCKHGQLLTDSALDISTIIYDSPWEDLSPKNKKILLFIMLRSQQAAYIRSMSITEISLQTFINIVNISWSLISLVTSIYED